MRLKMNWEQLIQSYPNEWVALIDYEKSRTQKLNGVLIAHNPNRKIFHEEIRKILPKFGNIAIRFTGELVKNPEIPLLWQISPIV